MWGWGWERERAVQVTKRTANRTELQTKTKAKAKAPNSTTKQTQKQNEMRGVVCSLVRFLRYEPLYQGRVVGGSSYSNLSLPPGAKTGNH